MLTTVKNVFHVLFNTEWSRVKGISLIFTYFSWSCLMGQDIWASAASVVTILVWFNLSLVSPPAVCASKTKSLECRYNRNPILLLHFLSIEYHGSGTWHCIPKCTQMSAFRLGYAFLLGIQISWCLKVTYYAKRAFKIVSPAFLQTHPHPQMKKIK